MKSIIIILSGIFLLTGVMVFNARSKEKKDKKYPHGVNGLTYNEWKARLTPEEFYILWQKGTERAFTGDLLRNKKKGIYVSAGCKQPVFSSEHKYVSGTGWPSFWQPIDEDAVLLVPDHSLGYKRWEVVSSQCGEHLGHVFKDGPPPTGLRYCINSLALDFIEDEGEDADKESRL